MRLSDKQISRTYEYFADGSHEGYQPLKDIFKELEDVKESEKQLIKDNEILSHRLKIKMSNCCRYKKQLMGMEKEVDSLLKFVIGGHKTDTFRHT